MASSMMILVDFDGGMVAEVKFLNVPAEQECRTLPSVQAQRTENLVLCI